MRMWYIILIVTILITMAGFLYLGHQVGKFQIENQCRLFNCIHCLLPFSMGA